MEDLLGELSASTGGVASSYAVSAAAQARENYNRKLTDKIPQLYEDAYERYIDGIETFNMHPGHNSRISIACKYLKENKDMLTCGGTDYHHEGHEGSVSLVSKFLPENSFDISDIIKSRDFIFDIHGIKIEVN